MIWRTPALVAAAVLLTLGTGAAQAQPTIYVLGRESTYGRQQSLFVFDGATNRKVAQIPLGLTRSDYPPDLAIPASGDRVYIVNTTDDSISVVSTATNTVVDTLPRDLLYPNCISGCSKPALAVSPDGSRLYYMSAGYGIGLGLSVLNVASRTRLNAVDVLVNNGMVLSPDGSRLFVRSAPVSTGSDVEVYDTAALATASTNAAALVATVSFPVGTSVNSYGIDVSSDGRFLYAPRSHGAGNYGVAVVSTSGNSFVTETPTPGANASAVAANGTTVYVTGRDSTDVLHRLDPTTHASLGTIPAVGGAKDVGFSSDGSRAYVATNFNVTVINTATHAKVTTLSSMAPYFAEAIAVRGAFSPSTGSPGAPTSLQATVAGNTITLNWGGPASGGAPTSYTLIGRLAVGGPVVGTLPVGAGTSFSLPVPDGTYVLTLTATNASGTGPESASVTVTVPQAVTAPGAPSNLTANVSGATANFGWVAPASGGPVVNYLLVAGLTPSFSVPFTSVSLGATASFSVPGVPAGTYYVRVHAQNSGGTSPPSNEVSLTVASLMPPGVPTLNAPTVSGSTVTLSWTPGSGDGPTSYTLAASVSPGGAPIATVPLTGTGVSFPGVPPGTYYLRLTATNAAGTSAPSADVTLVVP